MGFELEENHIHRPLIRTFYNFLQASGKLEISFTRGSGKFQKRAQSAKGKNIQA